MGGVKDCINQKPRLHFMRVLDIMKEHVGK